MMTPAKESTIAASGKQIKPTMLEHIARNSTPSVQVKASKAEEVELF